MTAPAVEAPRAAEPSSPCCPMSSLEPVGEALYRDFRRQYGLVGLAEERVAGLLGAVLVHQEASAILRLFARMIGAPPDGFDGEGEVVESPRAAAALSCRGACR